MEVRLSLRVVCDGLLQGKSAIFGAMATNGIGQILKTEKINCCGFDLQRDFLITKPVGQDFDARLLSASADLADPLGDRPLFLRDEDATVLGPSSPFRRRRLFRQMGQCTGRRSGRVYEPRLVESVESEVQE